MCRRLTLSILFMSFLHIYVDEDCSLLYRVLTGNSGGPLLDSSGKLIGMNTAIYSPSGTSAGIGFAIPSDTVKFIVETLIRDGEGTSCGRCIQENTCILPFGSSSSFLGGYCMRKLFDRSLGFLI